MRVITESVSGVRSAAIGLWVATGARDEAEPVAGAAHFLEHLLFKQTETRTGTVIAEEMDAVGGEVNAFTTKEHTCFYAHVLDEDMPLALDILTDVVFRSQLTASDMDTERSVVLEEIAMSEDDPEDVLTEAFSATLFPGHKLGTPVLGTVDSITAMSRDALYEFYREFYVPNRIILSVAGHVTHEQVLSALRKVFPAAWIDGPEPLAYRDGAFIQPAIGDVTFLEDDTEQVQILLGYPGLSRHDDRRWVLSVLNAGLGGGMSSRLFQEIREKRGLVYQVYSSASSYADSGHVSIYAGCAPERVGEVATVVQEVLALVAKEGLSEAEVKRAKGSLRGGMVLGLEDTSSRMSRLGKSEMNFGRLLSVDETLAKIEAVTVDQVQALATELLAGPATVCVVGPYSDVSEVPAELTGLT